MPLASINPPASRLGQINAILSGRARRYYVADFAGPLSLKSVPRGTARWTAGGRDFRVGPDDLLILNDGQNYSIEIDSPQPVETFCVFFARGYVEQMHRAAVTSDAELLDEPNAPARVNFVERRYPVTPEIGRTLAALRTCEDEDAAAEQFHSFALTLIALRARPPERSRPCRPPAQPHGGGSIADCWQARSTSTTRLTAGLLSTMRRVKPASPRSISTGCSGRRSTRHRTLTCRSAGLIVQLVC
jgi:hypothetical protein